MNGKNLIMQTYNIENDKKLFCVPATSFPDGVRAAFETFHTMLAPNNERPFYGVSYFNDKGEIIYKAAVEEAFEGEAEKYGCEIFILKKGAYLEETIPDWQKNKDKISGIFETMLKDERTDKNYPCVEWYKNMDDLVCMMRFKKINIF